MSRPFDTNDAIAAFQIAIFVIFLGGAVVLCLRHGFSKSAGWRFLIILSLARIIGGSLRLATVSDPYNTDLYVGWIVLNGLGLGPLVLALLGLLSRVFESINRQGTVTIKPMWNRALQLLMLVAMILLIVGGFKSDYTLTSGAPVVTYSNLSHIGTGLMIAVIVLLACSVALAFFNQGYVAQGEHRIILVVAACMPFVIVRLIYSCLLVFGGVTSSPFLTLGMVVIMEVIVVIFCEVLGFNLDKAPEQNKDQEMQGQQELKDYRRGARQ